VQADYKRLLAYSSIEHMGLIVFTWGLGSIGVAASLIHMVGHALAKSMLFFGAGNILLQFKSTKFENVHSLKRKLPLSRALLVFGIFALLAAPPSPLFFSEYLAILGAVKSHPYLLAIVLLALTLVLAGFMRQFMPILFEAGSGPRAKETWNLSHTAMATNLLITLILGVVLWTDAGRETIMRIASLFTV
jgi:hydrogenase-4 component F